VRAGAAIAAAVGAGTIATALVGAGYHYATDTLGGFCLATACVLSLAWVIDAVAGALPTVKV
jgi:undecaprenyl-diphosphatase